MASEKQILQDIYDCLDVLINKRAQTNTSVADMKIIETKLTKIKEDIDALA